MRYRLVAAVLVISCFGARPAVSQQSHVGDPGGSAMAEVLVLGVWHMASSGNHLFDTEADDILSSRRQAEMAELISVLERFQPTKIALEAEFSDSDVISARFDDYLNGELELSRNERQQIGFRLAKELGHTAVYSVDADGEYPFPRVQDYANARGRADELEAWMDEGRERAEAWNAFLASHTVLEALLHMNSDDYATLAFDYRIAHLGEPWNWAGPDLITDWFQRNIRIYSNVLRLIDSPDERVLVIIGAGHLGWLRHNFASDPDVALRKLAELVH